LADAVELIAHRGVHTVEALLRAPGDLQDVRGHALLAIGDRRADARRAGVVPGRLDE
jgi:hypothetical protein